MANSVQMVIQLVDQASVPAKKASNVIINEAKKQGLAISKQGVLINKVYKGQLIRLKEVGKQTKLTKAGIAEMGKVASQVGVRIDQYGRVIRKTTEATKKSATATKKAIRANNAYSKTSRSMRLNTQGLRLQLGKLRNTLLLLVFAQQVLQRGILRNVVAFAEFEKSLVNIQVMISKNAIPTIREFRRSIETLSSKFGLSAVEISKSMFDVFSATGDAAKSTDILNAATKLAVAGGSKLTDTTKGLVTLIESYGKELKGASDAADLLFVAQVKARATIGELATAVTKFLPLAAQLGISEEELFAVFTKLTVVSGDVNEAATQMSGLLVALTKPTEEMVVASDKWYNSSIQVAVAQNGLFDVLEKLKGAGITQIGELIRRKEALLAVFGATQDMEDLQERAILFTKRQGEMQKALNTQLDTTSKKLDILKARWQKAMRAIGEASAGSGAVEFFTRLAESIGKTLSAIDAQAPVYKSFEEERAGVMEKINKLLDKETKLRRSLNFQFGRSASTVAIENQLKDVTSQINELLEYQESLTSVIVDEKLAAIEATKKLAVEEKKAIEQKTKALEDLARVEERTQARADFKEISDKDTEAQFEKFEKDFAMFSKHVDDKLAVERWAADELNSILQGSSDIRIQLAQSTAAALQKAYSDLFFDIFTGQVKTAEEYFVSLGRAILREISNTIATLISQIFWQNLVLKVLGKEFNFVLKLTKAYWGLAIAKLAAGVVGASGSVSLPGGAGGTGGAGVGGTGSGGPGLKLTMHEGGMVKRYQNGGVVPALLETGEGVVSRKGMSGLGEEGLSRLNRGDAVGGNTYIIINAIDTESFRERLAKNADMFSSTVRGEIEANAPLRAVIRTLGG